MSECVVSPGGHGVLGAWLGLLLLAGCAADAGGEGAGTGGSSGSAGSAGAGSGGSASIDGGGCPPGELLVQGQCVPSGQGCTDECSGHGSCAGSECQCFAGYAGVACGLCDVGFERSPSTDKCQAPGCDGGQCVDTGLPPNCNTGCTRDMSECLDGRHRICDVSVGDGCWDWRGWADCPGGTCFSDNRCGSGEPGLAAVQWGSPSDDYLYALIVTPTDDVVVAGTSIDALGADPALGMGDFVLQQRSGSTLAPVWTHQFGTAQWDALRGLAWDGSGQLLATGESQGLVGATQIGHLDPVLLRRNPDGTADAAAQWGNDRLERAYDLALDSQGNIYVSGEFFHATSSTTGYVTKLDSDYNVLWTDTWPGGQAGGFALVVDAADAVLVAGTLNDASTVGRDAFCRKLNSAGVEQWTTTWGSSESDVVIAAALKPSGELLVTGFAYNAITNATGTSGAFVSQLDAATGSVQWTQQFGVSADDAGRALAVAPDGSFYVAGDTTGELVPGKHAGGDDVFLQKRNAQGQVLYTVQFGTSATDRAQAMGLASDGTIYIGGYTSGNLPGYVNQGVWDDMLLQYRER